jgi:hypothetical protein
MLAFGLSEQAQRLIHQLGRRLGRWDESELSWEPTRHDFASHADEGFDPLPAGNRDELINAEKIFHLNYAMR